MGIFDFLGFVVFVVNVAENFLDNILQRDESVGASVFVHNDRHVDAAFLEFLHEVVESLAFRDKVRLAQQFLPGKMLVAVQVRQQVFYIQYSLNRIERVVVSRNPRIA